MASSSSDSSPALAGNHLPYLLDRTEDFNAFSQPSLSAPFTSSRGSIGGLVSPLTRGERLIIPKVSWCAQLIALRRADDHQRL